MKRNLMCDLLGKLLTCVIQIFPTAPCLDLAQSQPKFFQLALPAPPKRSNLALGNQAIWDIG
jgi:hypothetical protein